MGQPSQRQPSPRQPSPRPFTQLGRRALFAIGFAALVLGLAFGGPSTVTSQRRAQRAPIPDDAPPRPENNTACNYQEPIDYLVRENFLPRWTQPPEEQRRREALQAQAVQFRTEQYGYFEGFGRSSWNEHPPMHYAERTRFMDLSVRLNAKIIPALACVEEQIRAECADEAYTPVRLSGIRDRNTYHNGQVSNHVYGIAIDVDPQLNTCCMCVAQWGDHPLCQREVESIYERMSMPSCWVHVFERFGFYWLGRDRLQDTMHFEFLGDPDHVLKTQGPAPHMAGSAEAAAEPTAVPEVANENAEGAPEGSVEVDAPPAEELTMSEASTTASTMAPPMASPPADEAEEAAEVASAGCSVSTPGR